MPGLRLIRPADANEVAAAGGSTSTARARPPGAVPPEAPRARRYGRAGRDRPGAGRVRARRRGRRRPRAVLVGTGSEVALCVDAAATLRAGRLGEGGLHAVVDLSKPARPTSGPRCCLPACRRSRWRPAPPSAGPLGRRRRGLDRFGASAPGATALRNLGFDASTSWSAPRAARRIAELKRGRSMTSAMRSSTTTARPPGSTTSPADWHGTAGSSASSTTTASARHLQPVDLREGDGGRMRATTSSSRSSPAAGRASRTRTGDVRSTTSAPRADVLRPTHDRLGGADGFVSLEVNPDLAGDTAATVAQVAELAAGSAGRT